MLQGYYERQNIEWKRTAWQTMHIINLFSKSKVTVDKLLGIGNKVNKIDIKNKKEQWKELKDDFNL